MRIIDSREPKERKERFQQEGFEVKALSAGDFLLSAFDGKKVGIEYKEDEDLINSLAIDRGKRTSRLERELLALKEQVDYPILLLGGIYLPTKRGYLQILDYARRGRARTFTSVQNLLLSIELSGIIVVPLPVPSLNQLVRSVLAIENYFQKPVHAFLRTIEIDPKMYLLSSIHGVGEQSLHQLKHLSLTQIFTSSKRELTKLVGSRLAHCIIKWRGKT